MLRVEAPTPFILTLQSVPPFLVESILALALVVLLAVPLIAHIQLLLDNSSKSPTMGVTNRRKLDPADHRDRAMRTVVMHYPQPRNLQKDSNSEINVELASMRTTLSTPTVKRSLDKAVKGNDNVINNDDEMEQHKQILQNLTMAKQKTCLPLERSSPFVVTNAQLPIIDISAFDYDAYRHKLIESSLKRQYGDRQAPGNVVLNSIHLNSIGSQTGIELSERYSHSLFDFIEEYYDVSKLISKSEKEYLHPLDHFLVKGTTKPVTVDRATETKESNAELDQVPEMKDFRDQSPIPSNLPPGNLERRRILEELLKNPSKLTIRSQRSSSLSRTPSKTTTPKSNPGAGRKSSTNPMTQQLFNRAENVNSKDAKVSSAAVTSTEKMPSSKKAIDPIIVSRNSRSRTPRSVDNKTPQSTKAHETLRKRASSAIQGKSSTESFNRGGTTKPNEYSEAPSTDRDEKESVTCASASSSEAGSSCSSKPREKCVVRSRASSLSSKSRTIGKTPSQTKQWYVGGSAKTSFHRNYFEVQKEASAKCATTKSIVRPRSTGGGYGWDVPDVPGSNWCDEIHPNKKSSTVVGRPKTVNPVYNRRRSPEKGKQSDTVLPVLESVVDLRVDIPWDDPNECRMDNDPIMSSENTKRTPSPARHEFRRSSRSKDKKISSASFVKSSSIARPSESGGLAKSSAIKRSNGKDNLVESELKVVEKSSSGNKPPSSRPQSASKLPVHVGSDRITMKMSENSNRTESTVRSKLLDESPGQESNSNVNFSVKRRRPRTAGCVQSRTSSLSPKIELSLEAFQSNAPDKESGVENKVDSKNAIEKSTKRQESSKIPSRSSSLTSKKVTPASHTSVNKMVAKPPSSMSENDRDIAKENANSVGKKPFLRARSGKHGAPKLSAIEQKRKTLNVDPTTSKNTLENNNEETEKMKLIKLPTEESKAALVMRRELKTYIKKIKLILSNRDKTLQAKDLALLSTTETIIPEVRAHLGSEEIQELQSLLDRVEKQHGNVLPRPVNEF